MTLGCWCLWVMGQSSRSREENVSKVVNATSSEFDVFCCRNRKWGESSEAGRWQHGRLRHLYVCADSTEDAGVRALVLFGLRRSGVRQVPAEVSDVRLRVWQTDWQPARRNDDHSCLTVFTRRPRAALHHTDYLQHSRRRPRCECVNGGPCTAPRVWKIPEKILTEKCKLPKVTSFEFSKGYLLSLLTDSKYATGTSHDLHDYVQVITKMNKCPKYRLLVTPCGCECLQTTRSL